MSEFPKDHFADILTANSQFVNGFQHSELTGTARKGLAIVTASYLLGVNRVLVMPHTDCRMASADEAAIHATINDQFGVDTRSLEFRTVSDQRSALAIDVTRIRSYPLLQKGVSVAGAIYDVSTGQLEPIDC